MADHHRASLVMDALTTAAGHGRLQPGCIAPSDRGSEYTSGGPRREPNRSGLRGSTGGTGSYFDDTAAQSFLALLRAGIGARHRPGRATARTGTFTFLGTFCGRRRPRKRTDRGCLIPLGTRQQHGPGHALVA
jgi:hypothetical protein